MNNHKLYEIGDKVQAQDGRIGAVIDSDRDPTSQTPEPAELVVVKFPDGSTISGAADKFKLVNEKPFSHVGA